MSQLKEAVGLIKTGKLVIFPTETVYGLGANAFNDDACAQIFKVKQRPANNPLIIHCASLQHAMEFAEFNEDAKMLSQLWPGPISFILPQKSNSKIAKNATAGLNTIAIRVPGNDNALSLIRESDCPIAAPSANISGRLSSTRKEHVVQNFKEEVFILSDDLKHNSCGLESSIIDLTTKVPTILRHGFVTSDVIEPILGKTVKVSDNNDKSKIKAPGMMYKHYSPITKIRINANILLKNEIGLNFGDSKLNSKYSLNLSPNADLQEAAANLFHYLHMLDNIAIKNNFKAIAVAKIPQKSLGLAINDRLSRGAI